MVLDFNGDGADNLAYPFAVDLSPGDDGGPYKHFWRMLQSVPTLAVPFGRFVLSDWDNGTLASQGSAWAIDYDLDGLVDLLPFDNDNRVTSAVFSKPWRPILSRSTAPTAVSFYPVNTQFRGPITGVSQKSVPGHDPVPIPVFATFADFDGDGYQDTLEYIRDAQAAAQIGGNRWWYVRFRTGEVNQSITGPTPHPEQAEDTLAFSDPTYLERLDHVETQDLLVLDMNGDGQSEILFRDSAAAVTLSTMEVEHGGQSIGHAIGLPAWLVDVERVFLDVNGDGLLDLLTHQGQSPDPTPFDLYVRFNRGKGFSGPQQIVVPNQFVNLKLSMVIDYNSDGCDDLLFGRPSQSTDGIDGMHLLRASTHSSFTFEVQPDAVDFAPRPNESSLNQMVVLDVDGDGEDDILAVEPGPAGVGTHRFAYYRHKQPGRTPDQLVRIEEGLNKTVPTVAITYGPLSAHPEVYERGTCDRREFNCAINPYYVVSKVERDAGLNGAAAATTVVSEYTYKTSITHKTSRAWLGFAEQRVRTAPSDGSQTPVTVRRFYSNTEARRDLRLLEEWTYGALPDGERWLERYRQTWDHQDTVLANGQTLPYNYVVLRETWSYQFPADTDLDAFTPAGLDVQDGAFSLPFRFGTVVHDQVINLDGHGNVTRRRSMFGPGAFQTIVETSYDPDLDAWLLARPQKVTTTQILAGCGVIAECSETRTEEVLGYARNASGEPTPLPRTIRRFHTDTAPGLATTVTYDYDGYGNVTCTTTSGDVDGQGTVATRASCVTYDPDGVFPHAVGTALGHTAYLHTDPLLGLPTVAVDANGRRTDTQYDTLGRPVKV